MLALMSKEAETLRYDSRTPKFEGIAHEQVDGDEELEWMEGGVEGARKWATQVHFGIDVAKDADS